MRGSKAASGSPLLRVLVPGLAAAALVACPTASPPPAASGGAPALPGALAPPPARQAADPPAPGSNSFSVVGVAADDVLNVRSAPDASSSIMGSIPPGTDHVIGVGTPTQVGQTVWQRVSYGGMMGWVNARFLTSAAGVPAAGTSAASAPGALANLSALEPLICFGNEPFWGIQFQADGRATCDAMCEGPPGLRVANVSLMPSGDPQGFDLLDAQGGLFLRGVLRRTGKCSDGMSDNLHPYEFTGTGKRGPFSGCCRDKRVRLPPQ
jgi:uncharacterized membrane protein